MLEQVKKKRTGWRFIDHMSHPRWKTDDLKAYRMEHGESPPDLSVNDGISKEDCPVDFPRFDAVVKRILELGRGTWLAARDFADAYEAEFVSRACPGRNSADHICS